MKEKEKPLMVECEECQGCGEVQAQCVVCRKLLTTKTVEPETDDLCRKCAKKEAS